MKMAGAGDKGKYPSRLATTRKSTSTSKTSWDLKTSRRTLVPTTSSTWPIFRWPETLTSASSGAARFKKHNNTCGTAESITSVRHVTLTARGDPQRACISGIPMATSGSLWFTRNKGREIRGQTGEFSFRIFKQGIHPSDPEFPASELQPQRELDLALAARR